MLMGGNLNMKKPLIIAIAAVSGGGKTTVIKELSNKLISSKAIYFDDYDFENCPEDFFQWVNDGADYNAWNLEKLKKDIDLLLVKNNLDYILLDYPFAYKNNKVASYIDYAVFIDTPLDIAMARRILRDLIHESTDLLQDDLNYYLTHGRTAYLEMLKTIKPNSDFIIDGSLHIDEIVNQIMIKILQLKIDK